MTTTWWRYAAAIMLVSCMAVGTGCDDSASTPPETEDMGGTPEPEGEPDPQPTPEPEADVGVELDMGDGDEDMGEVDMAVDQPEVCDDCETDDDCADGAVCLTIGEVSICTQDCSDAGEACPDGYRCADLGDLGEQCVPEPEMCLGCDAPGEAEDICDGFDNDCDGAVDEDFVAEGCGDGACAATSACIDGVLDPCVPGMPGPDDLACDGVDEDCDGLVDEDYETVICGEGLCQGLSACDDGAELMCVPDQDQALPQDGTCDAVDEDCDGEIDEDYVGEPCGVGACAAVGVCDGGEASCTPGAPLAPNDVTCNATDEDCDGALDEDFESEEFCGFGACRVAAVCDGGEAACTPLEPQFDVDQNCEGDDEDCDGQVDENCVANALGFLPVEISPDEVIVDLNFSQQGAIDENNARFFQPRVIDIVVRLPDGLDVQARIRNSVVPGQAAIDAEKQVRGAIEPNDDRLLRITVISLSNDNRIAPGQIAQLRLVRVGDPPFDLRFEAALCAVAPEEANDVIEFQDAVIGAP